MNICPISENIAKMGSQLCQMLNEHSNIYQRLLKFSQSDEI